MIRDITLGQYYQVDSILHRLDPRIKLFGTMIYVISLFAFQNITVYICAFIFLVSVIALSKVPVKFIVRGIRGVITLLIMTSFLNIFLTPGTVIWQFGFLKITYEGIVQAVTVVIRLFLLIMGSSIMTLTTTPNQLTDGLERSMRFLNMIKVPVHEIAMMMSIALRFIPILLEETNKIMKAQLARGADFETGNIIKRVKAMIPILIPLFVAAFRRANDLAMAMEARCYKGGEGRTKMKPLKYKGRDFLAYFILISYFVGMLFLGWIDFIPLLIH